MLLLLAGGIVAGFQGHWWGQKWIWTALIVLVVTSVVMGIIATPYYRRLGFVARAKAGGSTAVSDEQFAAILSSSVPFVLAAVGFGAIIFILYLMVFKPW
jgi:uncharacterized membrane protein